MGQPEKERGGMLTEFLVEDHRRLDGLMHVAMAHLGTVDDSAYGQFRAGLLRHIGMEEKILLPTAQRQRGGEPLSLAAKLRLDHGALASLSLVVKRRSSLGASQLSFLACEMLRNSFQGFYGCSSV